MSKDPDMRPEIESCACGQDHETMPMIDVWQEPGAAPIWREGVCRIHKRHIPCRPCATAKRIEEQ